ncbi:zinc ABC transporter ATP-binding protein [Dissulfurispira thermophila]|uniref:Zinc ABC transporter ATP-binding protein n=2 Tax=root TaxID=1 RepID=A0A7G1GZB9_9BACT|nr:metal ABC transporter ATP-binding protein [Dissulfurispira thermophila]BCB95835.1 zinc ABC transporter ATP-binding protein [Dissulfurispira thermophila]
MNAVEIKNLDVSINNKEILKDINLELAEGRFLGIVGPNGSGKTTLLRVIIGIIKPKSGSIKIFGDTPIIAIKKGIFGYLPQSQMIETTFPARAIDVVLMGIYSRLGVFSWHSKEEINLAKEMLSMMNMSGYENELFGNLSGGQQQRVSIARALINNPKILVLDEPSTGIDVVGQEDFYHLLKGLQKKLNLTIIMVSHDIGAVTSYVDEIACLNKTLHYHGSPLGALNDTVIKQLYGKHVDIMMHTELCDKCERLQSGQKN